MTVLSAITPMSAHRLPPPAPATGVGPWLDRVDSNGRRLLTLYVAPGVKALADLARESNLGSPGAWQATTSFFFTANILLIPSMTEQLGRCIARLGAKRRWAILKLRHMTDLFYSSLLLLMSTVFTANGLKGLCQLSGYAVKPLEKGLNAISPWLRVISRITAFFQIHDLVTGSRFRAKINKILQNPTHYGNDNLVLCDKALRTIEKYRRYLRSCREYGPLASEHINAIRDRLKSHLDDQPTKEEISLMTHDVVKVGSYLTQVSENHTQYQTVGLLANCLSLLTMAMTHSTGTSILTCAVSAGHIFREVIWKNNKL